jgi:hypothetical protein
VQQWLLRAILIPNNLSWRCDDDLGQGSSLYQTMKWIGMQMEVSHPGSGRYSPFSLNGGYLAGSRFPRMQTKKRRQFGGIILGIYLWRRLEEYRITFTWLWSNLHLGELRSQARVAGFSTGDLDLKRSFTTKRVFAYALILLQCPPKVMCYSQ